MKSKIPESEFRRAANRLKCDVAAVMAVAEVESPKGPFLPTGEPTILFEPHIFSRLTKRRFDKSHPKLSYPNWKAGAYGAYSAQHGKLQKAALLDRSAALQSCSWGQFQIMGFNYARCGHRTIQSFVNAMYASAAAQFDAFVAFNLADPALVTAIRGRMWATYARIYNGPAYATHKYDQRLAAAYARHVKNYPARPDFSLVQSAVFSTGMK